MALSSDLEITVFYPEPTNALEQGLHLMCLVRALRIYLYRPRKFVVRQPSLAHSLLPNSTSWIFLAVVLGMPFLNGRTGWVSVNANAETPFLPSCPFPICFLLVAGTGVLVPLVVCVTPGG